jgi:hypothetical protein
MKKRNSINITVIYALQSTFGYVGGLFNSRSAAYRALKKIKSDFYHVVARKVQ